MQISKATYLGSFVSVGSCPVTDTPEYAFIGRSNVGKSSLINMLCNRKDLARVSNVPGKTQTINLFDINGGNWILADLPGYGYASVSKSTKRHWPQMITTYLQKRENLVCAFILLDIRLPLQKIDHAFIHALGTDGVPFAIIYTKADKLTRQQRLQSIRKIEDALLEEWDTLPDRFMTSALSAEGREQVLGYIGSLNEKVKPA